MRFAVSISSPLMHSRRTYPSSGGGIGTALVSRWRVTSGTTAPSAQSSSVGSSRNSKVASSFGSPTSGAVIMKRMRRPLSHCVVSGHST